MEQIEQLLEGAAAQAAKDKSSNGDRERSMDDVSGTRGRHIVQRVRRACTDGCVALSQGKSERKRWEAKKRQRKGQKLTTSYVQRTELHLQPALIHPLALTDALPAVTGLAHLEEIGEPARDLAKAVDEAQEDLETMTGMMIARAPIARLPNGTEMA